MSLLFKSLSSSPLDHFEATAPDGTIIGVVGENGAGKSRLLRLAAGLDKPSAGTVKASGDVRYLGPDDPMNLTPAPVLLIDQTFARQDQVVRDRAAVALDHLRRAGATVMVSSHEEDLVRRLCDEVWWLQGGRLAGRGDPAEMLTAYRKHSAAQLRAWGEMVQAPVAPKVRRGDGRAEIVRVETVGETGKPTMVWRSGERAVVKVGVRFKEAVADPVVGIMIRTRVGLNVYGTNTDLEQLKLGPCPAGTTLDIAFAFWCELCPQEYTLTVASHDPDGVWHDWLEDAVAFSVADGRYTAGVANLRAQVSLLSKA
ncbi:MAG TPA: Wzt carbohydrate-binding domain-containing protein [Candidatus Acidoferrales bacterium]|nr:Wzt carbohydrate-binding domain-containing protein [Candidatus Acidoferrales bacterium]